LLDRTVIDIRERDTLSRGKIAKIWRLRRKTPSVKKALRYPGTLECSMIPIKPRITTNPTNAIPAGVAITANPAIKL
jgi:hypothetical protein